MALAWVLNDNRVTSVIVGASSVEQLKVNMQSIKNTGFSEEEIRLIDKLTR
jgi:L-glyceraldehyde 3-phosphate reductase